MSSERECPECGGELLADDELCQFCRSNAVHREWHPELYDGARDQTT